MKKIYFIFYIFILFIFIGCASKEPKLLTYEQNTSIYIDTIQPLDVNVEKFYSRYFMPWNINKLDMSEQKAAWANYSFLKKDTYYTESTLPWDIKDIKNIINTTNFSNYNSQLHYAITTQNEQIRSLPTHKPFFINPSHAGEGFPFDYLQNSRIHVNTPILISHYNNDASWAFVQAPFASGWLPVKSIAILDAKQRTTFRNNKKIVITKDNSPIYSKNQKYLLHVKLGALFPLLHEDENFYYSYVYKDTFYDGIKALHVRIPKSIADTMPLAFNKQNILHVSGQLLGENYGWGGYLNNRDCSAFTKDYFSTFGLWLPRNSYGQKLSGKYISFEGLSNEEKEKMILNKGIAFLSMIYLNGHIMLYAGEHESKAMVFHNMWGVRTYEDGQEGRNVIGKAIISDLYLGNNQSNVKQEALLLSKAKGIVIKPDMPSFIHHNLAKVYPSIENIANNLVYFEDNTSLEYHDYVDKSFQTLLDNPSVKDTLSLKYPAFQDITPPSKNFDPGRFRNDSLLNKLYGNTKKEIESNLVKVTWINGKNIYFNKQQNAAYQLEKIIAELKKLPKKYNKYITNIGGTYNYRYISGTKRLSAHSYGIAIDLNVKQSAYWKWDKKYNFSNKFPKEIIDIFEKYGFIWGGRWYHYDTMHFEYRPELFDNID